jgi:conjugative transfer signal peptidase TraF
LKAKILVLVAPLLYAGVWSSGYGLAVNPSISMPRGLYLLSPIERVTPGSMVAACISDSAAAKLFVERGYLPASERCSSGAAPIIKPIAAGPGDRVNTDDAGLRINGRAIESSRTADVDTEGRPLPHLKSVEYRLSDNEYFVVSTHTERSLDSRYFGPIHEEDVLAQARPLLTE